MPPFLQNYIAATDEMGATIGGKQHYQYRIVDYDSSSFPRYISFYDDKSSPISGSVDKNDGMQMFLNSNLDHATGANLKILPHETLHWLGQEHPHEQEILKKFLAEWGTKTGDVSPSIASYGGTYLFESDVGMLAFDKRVISDDRYAYLRTIRCFVS